nr:NanT5 [Kibdelosporangium sp. MJ126-NF4]
MRVSEHGEADRDVLPDVRGHAEDVASKYMRGMRWSSAGISVVILYGLELPKLLANWDSYRPVEVQIAALAVLTVVSLVCVSDRVVRLCRRPLIAVVLATSIAATLTVAPVDRLGTPHWSDEIVGWPLVLLAMGRTAVLFAGLLAVHYVPAFLLAIFDGPVDVTFAGAVNTTVVTSAFQVSVVLFANALRRVAMSVARRSREEEQARTADAVASQLHADRKDRYAALAETTAPVLAGLASGTLNPGDETVRRTCAIEAARMRRLFGETTVSPDPLVDELMACVGLAERNGVSVRFSERGERPPVPVLMRRLLTEPAVAVLATARGNVRLTVVGAGEQVTVSVVADSAPYDLPVVDNDEITTSTVTTGDRMWVQATWRGRG